MFLDRTKRDTNSFFISCVLFGATLLFLSLPVIVSAQEGEAAEVTTLEHYRAKVIKIVSEKRIQTSEFDDLGQVVRVEIIKGEEKGEILQIEHSVPYSFREQQKVREGEKVILTKTQGGEEGTYYITDKYRLPPILFIFAIFLLLAVLVSGWRGFTSVLGLGLSIAVLIGYIVPQIVAGANPLFVSVVGAMVIALLSLYLAHGFNKRTTVALVSTVITLWIAFVVAQVFVSLTKLSGLGSEEAFFLQIGPGAGIDLRGLLLGAIIIGALGVLDDITATQSAAVVELKKANPKFTLGELYQRGVAIGREHISSMINTLVLAYIGASLPLLLIFTLNMDTPLLVLINSEFVAEEIVRTLVGSIALILAVPISTLMAAYVFSRRKIM